MKFSEFLRETDIGTIGDFHTDDVDVSKDLLTSLETHDIPKKIGGSFNCSVNKLTTLVGGPTHVLHNYVAGRNLLSSFEGFPEFVGMQMQFQNNRFTSLKGIHKHLKRCNGTLFANGNKIVSHVLGLLLIDKLEWVALDDREVENIINKYLPNTRGNDGVFDCQQELIDAGKEEFAQL
jgi:hypothetical protein